MFLFCYLHLNFTQKIHHFAIKGTRMNFTQSYFVDDTTKPLNEAKSIILQIGDATSLSANEQFMHKSLHDLALQTNSTLLALEHRFFGTSRPKTVTNYIQYDIIPNILEDIADLLEKIKEDNPQISKILVAGQGYAGTLAAWFRIKYPNIVAGSWSSSSPIRAITYFPEFDDQLVYRLEKINKQCLVNSDQIMKEIDNLIFVQKELTQIYELFGFPITETPESISYTLSEGFSLIERAGLLEEYCQKISYSRTLMTYAMAFNKSMAVLNAKISDFNLYDLDDPEKPRIYLQCKNVGWFHVYSNNTQYHLRSQRINESFFQTLCRERFTISQFAEDINYYIDPKKSHISSMIFTYRDFDPYAEIGIEPVNYERNILYLKVKDGYHGWDISPREDLDNEKIKDAREQVINYAKNIIIDNCSQNCHPNHGYCIEDKCVCKLGFTGESCEDNVIPRDHYRYFVIIISIIFTMIFITIMVVLWNVMMKSTK